jgi:hypothetical protein
MQSFCKGAVKDEVRVSHRQRQLMLLENQWTAIERKDGRPAKAKRLIGIGIDLGPT